MLPSCTAGPGPWRARVGLSRKTVVYWDTKKAGRSASGQGPLCAMYPSQESVSGILKHPATKWDRAGRAFDASGRVSESLPLLRRERAPGSSVPDPW